MVNVFFEIDHLRSILESKGIDTNTVNSIVSKVHQEIQEAVNVEGGIAIERAVEVGVQKSAPDFINELRLDTLNFEVTTDSGNMDFSVPPYPMLPSLLKNAKPMKDGSGVYKVIPVGKPGNKPSITTNIYDAQKKIAAQRAEDAKRQYQAISPAGSKGQQFRVATSKQNPNTQWVRSAQEKDFTGDVAQINAELHNSLDDRIKDIINHYLELF